MKNVYIFTLLLGVILSVVSCSNKSVPVENSVKKTALDHKIPSNVATEVFDKAPITKKAMPSLEDQEKDCHGQRNISQTLEEIEAAILKIGDKYVISADNGTSRYMPCKLPKRLKKDGLLVRITGEVLEIFPGERLMATPFRLKHISERDQ